MSTRDRGQSGRSRTEIEDEAYSVMHDDSRGSLSTTVVLSLCEIADADPSDFQLYRYIDPDALDSLFGPVEGTGRERVRVELTALDHRVTIHASEEIMIRPVESAASTGPSAE